MLTEAQVAQYHADGFVKGSKVLDEAQLQQLRAEMARVIRDQDRKDLPQPVLCRNLSGNSDAPVWQIVNIWEASEPFRKLIDHPTITEEAARLTDARELRIWHDQIQYKPAGTGGVNMWHQDSPYWPILEPKSSQITAWVALDDVDSTNGCMSMVPGSHHWGNQIEFLRTLKSFDAMPPEFHGQKVDARLCPVRAGEVHFHHPLVWHGSHANTSNRPRRAIALHYITPETRYAAAGNHPMKPFVEVADGEVLRGGHFPVVWKK